MKNFIINKQNYIIISELMEISMSITPKILKVIDNSGSMRYTVIVEDNKHKDNDVVCKYGHCLFLFFKGDV